RLARLPLERVLAPPRSLRRRAPPRPLGRRAILRRLLPCALRGALARAVLAASDVVHLLAHELARLRRCRFAFALVLLGALDGFFFRHVHLPVVTFCKIAAQILWRDDRAPTTLVAMRDDALSATLEAALLRQLLGTWRTLNDSYFKGRLQAPTLALVDGAHKLGQWLAGERRIELQRAFVVDGAWGAVVEVLKHEMAHQFVSEALGDPDPTPHGPAFRAVCERHGIDASAAGVPDAAATPEADRIVSRVAKLLALAESPNVHEAELAMAEAQRLLLKHNLDATTRSAYSFRHLGTPAGRV